MRNSPIVVETEAKEQYLTVALFQNNARARRRDTLVIPSNAEERGLNSREIGWEELYVPFPLDM